MGKQRLPTDAPDLGVSHLPVNVRKRDRDVVMAARYILAHSKDISRESAYALLVSASKQKKE